VCVCIYIHTHTHTHTYIYIYIYIYICVCVCACVFCSSGARAPARHLRHDGRSLARPPRAHAALLYVGVAHPLTLQRVAMGIRGLRRLREARGGELIIDRMH